jgi:hypothetical protein
MLNLGRGGSGIGNTTHVILTINGWAVAPSHSLESAYVYSTVLLYNLLGYSTSCIATCLDDYRFPKGEQSLTITCQGEAWLPTTGGYDEIPDCKGIWVINN